MKNRVTIQEPDPNATAGDGGTVDLSVATNWRDKDSRPCHIFTRSGAEKWRFNQVSAEISRIVHLHRDSLTRQITPDWRLKFMDGATAKYWDIATAFDVDEAHKTIEVHCTEVVT